MQNDMFDIANTLTSPEKKCFSITIQRLISRMLEAGGEIIFIKKYHSRRHKLFTKCNLKPFCVQGTYGANILDDVRPRQPDYDPKIIYTEYDPDVTEKYIISGKKLYSSDTQNNIDAPPDILSICEANDINKILKQFDKYYICGILDVTKKMLCKNKERACIIKNAIKYMDNNISLMLNFNTRSLEDNYGSQKIVIYSKSDNNIPESVFDEIFNGIFNDVEIVLFSATTDFPHILDEPENKLECHKSCVYKKARPLEHKFILAVHDKLKAVSLVQHVEYGAKYYFELEPNEKLKSPTGQIFNAGNMGGYGYIFSEDPLDQCRHNKFYEMSN
jgi:nicotinamidase-related amidase